MLSGIQVGANLAEQIRIDNLPLAILPLVFARESSVSSSNHREHSHPTVSMHPSAFGWHVGR
ncbi:hypothetical protein BV98_002279 [Sphingobium herbicidovorans NBRC 16415]|uniref:Uncharacterized protein n=1 Tax=Sphingobium herbicidovorans (strain ATCC 700291 / DSM 11019 / CCUG 56400 / KCTC 2939 / LMG 18315 / NBRC 16415 / MH) TaxID=1219045 RepID=A0A086P9B5_SPHHM|nr:hypothetical protein BV98_002279 [Sphingobium herbicidovorans NBRC 16415]